jgi:carboxylesterase type B
VGFAKTGQPACNGQDWPTYTPASDQLLEIGQSIGVRTHWRKPQLDAAERQRTALISGK